MPSAFDDNGSGVDLGHVTVSPLLILYYSLITSNLFKSIRTLYMLYCCLDWSAISLLRRNTWTSSESNNLCYLYLVREEHRIIWNYALYLCTRFILLFELLYVICRHVVWCFLFLKPVNVYDSCLIVDHIEPTFCVAFRVWHLTESFK